MQFENEHKNQGTVRPGVFDVGLFVVLGFLLAIDYYLETNTWWEIILKSLVDVAMILGILYLNFHILIPRFLQKKRYFAYLLACLIATFGYVIFQRISGLELLLCEEESWGSIFTTVLDWGLYLYLSALLWYFRQFQSVRERQSLLRSEKLEAELKFLRAQISPHFIFNTLNNIYSLAIQGHPNAAPMVARLADILRYTLEKNKTTVPLKNELDAISQFIELQRLRNLPSENLDYYQEGNVEGFEIVPLLLLNFVENCFKHSHLDQDENAWVRIEADISPDGIFTFSTENSLYTPLKSPEKFSGIGLENARRQLELQYPNEYVLEIDEKKACFRVYLRLKLRNYVFK